MAIMLLRFLRFLRFLRDLLMLVVLAWGSLGLEAMDPGNHARDRHKRMMDNVEHGFPAD